MRFSALQAKEIIAISLSLTFFASAILVLITRPDSDLAKMMIGALIAQTGRVIDYVYKSR